ncbi:hypothetical protein ASPZODRAFT_67539 [Penicilliopsis zonata CBS 506.65]|uniref:Major facilitator superfamily (MFS) profile domain-containing protein n=1 Tax=Penicilliopsis zonata CBS 506.65 TaxID=1073090 RepID=A0A1L9SFZ6_9EURO|nr:hypothetical protein ASPZODRAFT_67539 [Penicilliopsis zonata CBS 506.65]OJJ46007.1 hypothetical protein ASPZODRAFT_67539 [Penicilliopsis zonata CBS 506.65]
MEKRQAVDVLDRAALYQQALKEDNVSPWSKGMLIMYLMLFVAMMNDTAEGFDSSLMSSINAMTPYHTFFHVGRQTGSTGIVFAIYSLGIALGAPSSGAIIDRWGRRIGMFIGAIIIIIGTILESAGPDIGSFMVGRFVIGWGLSISNISAITYLVEIIYPPWRGIFGGLYNVLGYYIGSIIASWVVYGTAYIDNNWSWRLPTVLQLVPSLFVLAGALFIPESPRWLMERDRTEEGIQILINHHGGGNPNSAVVRLEVDEIQQSIISEASLKDSRWWDLRPLFSTRGGRFRVWIIFVFGFFNQFTGGGVISYYQTTIYYDVGITSTHTELLISAISGPLTMCAGFVGSMLMEKMGRRKIMLWAVFFQMFWYLPTNVMAYYAAGDHLHKPWMGYLFVVFVQLYSWASSFGWTTLQQVYPAEILGNDMRAKGMSLHMFLNYAGSFVATYTTPIALENLGWKAYTVYLCIMFVEFWLLYFCMVETKGKTLEEIEEIFNDPNPVKKSLETRPVITEDEVVGV